MSLEIAVPSLHDARLADIERERGVRLPVRPAPADGLEGRHAPDLMAATFPPTAWLVEPILERPGLAMIYGPTGVAKTHLTLGLAIAAATGQPFLGWSCHKSVTVYIDGELGARRMQQRIGRHLAGLRLAPAELSNLLVITRDDQPHGVMPDLAEPESQMALLASLPIQPGLLILDNLSTLTGMLDSNDAASWSPMQELLLKLKSLSWGVVVVHHANKGGTDQAGTSRRTHVLDTVISLREHLSIEGSGPGSEHDIELHIVKGRELTRDQREPFLATLAGTDALTWKRSALESRQRDTIADLFLQGLPVAAIAHELKLSLATVYRKRGELERAGVLKPKTAPAPRPERPRGPG